MDAKKLKQLEIRISGTVGTSYRTIIDFDKNCILRSGIINDEKVDFIPSTLNELENNRLREKLTFLNVNTLRNEERPDRIQSDLYWQVVITGEGENLQAVGVDQLPREWGNFFRLLP
ncbi:hypothetical protein [Jeotgalibacillus malaysiensis]|uniref:hypothetical protein n=1 Tax=Jeotgalibacillus malaysiensis TaxID=1508404 RepID=UPI00384E36BC